MRRFSALAILALLPLLGSQPVLGEGGADEQLLPRQLQGTSPTVGDDAPAFILRAYNEDAAIRLARSPSVSLSSMVGFEPENPKKLVVLAFGAYSNSKSWQDIGTLQRIFKKFKDDGVAVLFVSVDRFAGQEVYESLEKEKVAFPVLRDRYKVVSRRYGVGTLPTLFLIDKEGKILSVGEGYQDNIEGYLDQEIRRRLQEG